MMTTSRTRRTKAVNLPLVLIGESEMTFQLARHPGNDAHHTSDGFPAHQQNEMLLSIQKFPPVIKLSFRIVCDPNMNYKVAPPFEKERKEMSLLKRKFSCWVEVDHSSGGHTLESLLNGSQPPLSPNRSQDFYGSLHLGRGGIRWAGILSSRETQFYTSVGIASEQGQRSATFEPWFSKEHSSQTFR